MSQTPSSESLPAAGPQPGREGSVSPHAADLDSRISGLFPVISPIVYPDTPLTECLDTILRGGKELALVLERQTERPAGMVDPADVIRYLQREGSPLAARVQDLMRPCADLVARPKNPSEALRIMEARGVPVLVLVNPDQSFQGLVARKDLLESENLRLREHTARMGETLDAMRSEIRAILRENSEVMSMLAHDLRGPLSGIQGICSLIASDGDRLERQQIRDFSGIMSEQLTHLLHLIKDVLELARCKSGKLPLRFAKCDPGALLRSVSQLYIKLAHQKKIAFELTLPEGPLPELLVDAERLRTVLGNLMDNAVKYCRAGERIAVRADASKNQITFVISDNGQGLSKEDQKKLFIRFGRGSSKTTNGEPSSGLGLAIAREIIQAHGGHIAVSGDTGQGLTFRVTLPIHDTPPIFPAEKP